MAAITEEITALLRETEKVWDSQDTTRMRELWDTDDDEPYYLAGEQEDWFVGWDAFNAYLSPPPGAPQNPRIVLIRMVGSSSSSSSSSG